ncbi:metallophosphoesterase [Psychrobacter sp. HD31]|uniref:metallophosphoesterase n=1 Tax=Psychrobacter sp. HD31 TaxID=3112003 RepID=UPI003DA62D5E
MIYDIIGDIHGQANKLVGLLTQLGYTLTSNQHGTYYAPPKNHRAIFIGDLIDRGEQEVKTLEIVFAMLDAGVADAVMGNHEYNALAFATLNKTKNDGSYLRSHSAVHQNQHKEFLAEVPFGSAKHEYWLKRFYELPLWIETEHACFIHACWDVDNMAVLQSCLSHDNKLTETGLQKTGQKHSKEYNALERLLKGVETPLPAGLYMLDKDGAKRRNVRVKWWLDEINNQPIHHIARAADSSLAQIPKDAITSPIDFIFKTDKPVFIGHYWMNGIPEPLSKQVVCVDYSAAIDTGFLTCYQFDTAKPLPLSKNNFVQFVHY